MRGLIAALVAFSSLSACSPAIKGVDEGALADAVGSAIGDPNTCVLLLTKDGDVAWRYGTHMTCARQLPSCGEPAGLTTVEDLGQAAVIGQEKAISCPSRPDGSTTVGWAAGPVKPSKSATHEPLVFAAVMEGDRALPGREIRARLEGALESAGL